MPSFLRICLIVATLVGRAVLLAQTTNTSDFELHDGDVVVFYGDSITEQRLYTVDIENFVLTRFPQWRLRFINSGVGGDTVGGGHAGPVDLRLRRDIMAHKPNMVTVMLGMNDGYVRPFDDGIFTTFTRGYRHIVEEIKSGLPDARITLLQPSAYDDVTREPGFADGYNSTLIRFGEMIGKLAAEKKTLLADLNLPVVETLKAAKTADPVLVPALISDRVHPGTGIQWVMAEAVLKAWHAPAVVSGAKIDAAGGRVTSTVNAEITSLQRTRNGLTWVQKDGSLPLPFPSADGDPFIGLVERVHSLHESLNQQRLQVEGLSEGTYELQIDGSRVASLSASELAKGINLAEMDTPMLRQAKLVAFDTSQKNQTEGTRFMFIEQGIEDSSQAVMQSLDAALSRAAERQRQDAQPLPHHYTLLRVTLQTPN